MAIPADPRDAPPAGPEDPASVERGVEGEEDRFYSRSEPGSAASLPPDPGTTPAELEPTELEEETDASGRAPAGSPPPRRP